MVSVLLLLHEEHSSAGTSGADYNNATPEEPVETSSLDGIAGRAFRADAFLSTAEVAALALSALAAASNGALALLFWSGSGHAFVPTALVAGLALSALAAAVSRALALIFWSGSGSRGSNFSSHGNTLSLFNWFGHLLSHTK